MQSDRVSDDLDAKMEEGKRILQSHRNEIDQFFNNANSFVTALSNDRTIHRLSADTQKLVRRLFLDDEGRPTLKAGTLLDVRKILGPILRSQLSYALKARYDNAGCTSIAWWLIRRSALHMACSRLPFLPLPLPLPSIALAPCPRPLPLPLPLLLPLPLPLPSIALALALDRPCPLPSPSRSIEFGRFVALPTLTFSDETVSWVMENVVLKGEDIVPDQIVVENYARAVIKPLSDEDDAAATLLRIRVYVVRMRCRTSQRARVARIHRDRSRAHALTFSQPF